MLVGLSRSISVSGEKQTVIKLCKCAKVKIYEGLNGSLFISILQACQVSKMDWSVIIRGARPSAARDRPTFLSIYATAQNKKPGFLLIPKIHLVNRIPAPWLKLVPLLSTPCGTTGKDYCYDGCHWITY